ncbi:MAG: hypothetical protein J1E03_11445 [Acetatifactor sp.]|nr:hypothetical protein [Acetatifactor sp.]
MNNRLGNILIVLSIALFFMGCSNTEFSQNRKETKEETVQWYEASIEEVTEEKTELREMGKEDEEKHDISNQGKEETPEDRKPVIVVLAEEEMTRIDDAIQHYYIQIHLKIVDYVQVEDTESFCFRVPYEGYEVDEIVAFEVTVENSEIKRHIIIGSTDGWNSCNILDEGY